MMESILETMSRLSGESTLLARLTTASLEFVVLALAVAALIALARVRHPRVVQLLWFIVLVKPLVSLALGAPIPLARLDRPARVTIAHAMASAGAAEPSGASEIAMAGRMEPGAMKPAARPMRWLPYIWGLGVASVLAWAFVERVRLVRIVRRAREADAPLSDALYRAARRVECKAPARLCVTDQLSSPALARILRPVILVPRWMSDPARRETLDWALAHELIHLQHGDLAGLHVRQLVRALFWFHPVAWWAGARWERAMETACDQALVRTRDDAARYAASLLEILDSMRREPLMLTGTGLHVIRSRAGRRIERLLCESWRAIGEMTRLKRAALGVLAIGVWSIGCAHMTVAPEYRIPPREEIEATIRRMPDVRARVGEVQSVEPGGTTQYAGRSFIPFVPDVEERIVTYKVTGSAGVCEVVVRSYQKGKRGSLTYKVRPAADRDGAETTGTRANGGGAEREEKVLARDLPFRKITSNWIEVGGETGVVRLKGNVRMESDDEDGTTFSLTADEATITPGEEIKVEVRNGELVQRAADGVSSRMWGKWFTMWFSDGSDGKPRYRVQAEGGTVLSISSDRREDAQDGVVFVGTAQEIVNVD
jgi:beta-lactamase regulating signal transducer with metallopeptidase domain